MTYTRQYTISERLEIIDTIARQQAKYLEAAGLRDRALNEAAIVDHVVAIRRLIGVKEKGE
jgi:hypothetical protein